MNYKLVLVILLAIVVGAGVIYAQKGNNQPSNEPLSAVRPDDPEPAANQPAAPAPKPAAGEGFAPPISRAEDRITKKPFGIKVSPTDSPVSPERFTGFHTGVDFEAFPDEQDKDVEVRAICDGQLLVKRAAQGYGGLVIQECKYQNERITVVYGHMRLSSVKQNVGNVLKTGDILGVLGTGYSAETDNERKHLHLGIHKGGATELRGYVQGENELGQWLDITKH